MAVAQLCGGDIAPHVGAEPKLDTLRNELLHPPFDEPLLDLELRHSEADETAGRLVALVDDDVLACPRELLGAGEPGRPGADDSDASPGLPGRRLRLDPAFAPAAVDDRQLDLLDRDGVTLVDLEHTGRLARSRAEPAR